MNTTTLPPAKRRKLDLRDNLREDIVVLVSPNKDKFTIPKALLTKSSDFFKACCNGAWRESETKTIELLDVQVDIFSTYLQWLYTEELVVTDEPVDSWGNEDKCRKRLGEIVVKPLVELAIFADKYVDASLANSVNDKLLLTMDRLRRVPVWDDVSRLYANLPAQSATLRVFVDLYAACGDPDEIQEELHNLPRQFLGDIWKAWVGVRMDNKALIEFSSGLRYANRCKYHTHDEKNPKTADCTDKDDLRGKEQGRRLGS